MIRFKLHMPSLDPARAPIVYVVLPVEKYDDYANFQVEGDSRYLERIRSAILSSYGIFHLMDEYTTAADLHCALRGPYLKQYRAELVEGHEIFSEE